MSIQQIIGEWSEKIYREQPRVARSQWREMKKNIYKDLILFQKGDGLEINERFIISDLKSEKAHIKQSLD